QEGKGYARKLPRQAQPKFADVIVCRMMIGAQGYQDVCVLGANRSGVAVGKINSAVGQADVVYDGRDFLAGNLLADRPLYQVTDIRRFLDTHPRGSAHVQLEAATVD